MNLALLISAILLFSFAGGIFLEKIRIPWIFSSLILGLILSTINPFRDLINSDTFQFLAELGMYFLLFLIGYELDFPKIKKLGRFVIKSTFFIILFEAIFGVLLIHFIFNISWFVAILVALSFATVGEAILIPILDKFNLTKTELGQTILGIGILDDIIEVFVVIAGMLSLSFLFERTPVEEIVNLGYIIFSITILFSFTLFIILTGRKISKIEISSVELFSVLGLAIFFLFIGIGKIAEISALGALLAGIFIKNILSEEKIKKIEELELKTLSYGFFGPLFFFWIGMDVDLRYLSKNLFIILLVMLVTYFSKIIGSFIVTRKRFPTKESLFIGASLCVRFSTSLVIIKLFFEKNLIPLDLYSILIATTIISIFIPFLLPFLIRRWNINNLYESRSN